MRNIKEWDLSDLETLCSTKAEESAVLEFKRSPALDNDRNNKEELCKDVSAMANAAGGNIVYGIAENTQGEADFIDDGCDTTVKPEWIDQVLTSGVEPKLQGLTIRPIPLPNGRRVFVVGIEQAVIFAPHQVRSRKQYYRRTERRVEAMLDYEIRDLMRRRTTPDLFLNLSVERREGKFLLSAVMGNNSSEPALYSLVILTFDNDLNITSIPGFTLERTDLFFDDEGNRRRATAFVKRLSVPEFPPIFKEAAWIVISKLEINPQPDMRHIIHYILSCPGFSGGKSGSLLRTGEDILVNLERLPH